MKVAVIAQRPIILNPGGAEVAAENLSIELAKQGHDVHLISGVPPGYVDRPSRVIDPSISLTRHFVPSSALHPYFRNNDIESVQDWFSVLNQVDPDVVHAHHFFHVGVNVLSEIFTAYPSVFTLHEYLAICHLDGQLLKRNDALCNSVTPLACLECNKSSQNDFGLQFVTGREIIFRNLLSRPRALIAPSDYLKQRFVEWGLNQNLIAHIPNIVRSPGADFRPIRSRRKRILYLSSITRIKGIEVLLRAASELNALDSTPSDISIEIWGTGDPSYISNVLKPLIESSGPLITFNGRFAPDQLDSVLSRASAVVCPSIWFENRPTVIDEALVRGIPVIASDIGGMREMITNSGGLTFTAGDHFELAIAIRKFLDGSPLISDFSDQNRHALDGHIAMYKSLLR